MIKIIKGEQPHVLERDGANLRLILEVNYDWYIADIRSGDIKFEYTDDYHSLAVKLALLECQHNKCCFSEAKFVGDFPHVEHFRPKGRIDNIETKEKIYPGYFWLAYEWSNLFLCKQVINVSYKKNYFPLLEEGERNRDHHDNKLEKPLFIDPSIDEPRDHIWFEMDVPRHFSERGRATIDLLGLKEEPFSSARRRLFRKLLGLKDLVTLLIKLSKKYGEDENDPVIKESLAILRESVKPEAEFSSMAIDLLQGWPHL